MEPIENQHPKLNTSVQLTHLTLNTRHTSCAPVGSLHPLIYSGLVPIVETGFGEVPLVPGFTVAISRGGADSVQLSFAKNGIEVIAGALIWGKKDELPAWQWLSSLFDVAKASVNQWGQGQAPVKPNTFPWLGVVLLPTMKYVTGDEAHLLGGFESALALAILRHRLERN